MRHLRAFCLTVLLVGSVASLPAQQPAPGASQRQSVDMPPEGRIAEVNNIKLYYEEYGKGEPLLLIHGFGGSSFHWKPFIPEFAKQYRVIAVDMRGHGRSTNNPSNATTFTHRQSALDMFALLDHLKIKTIKAMGISSGGMTLLHMATQQPARVDSMVLIGATIYFPEPARKIMRRSTVESIPEQEWPRLRQVHKYGDDQIRSIRTMFHNFKDSYDDMNFTAPLLGTITAKTFVVHGDRDEFFPVNIPVEMYTSIPASYLWIIPNGDHVPIVERPQQFTEQALAFLQGKWEKKAVPTAAGR